MVENGNRADKAEDIARELFFASHNEKHEMEQTAVQTALAAEKSRLEDHRVAHADAHGAHERIHTITEEMGNQRWVSHIHEHESIARNLAEYKAQSNEWRGSLVDLRSNFAPLSRVDSVQNELDRRYEELRSLIATEREERRSQEGVKKGMSATTGIIVGAVALAATVITVVVVVVNFVTAAP